MEFLDVSHLVSLQIELSDLTGLYLALYNKEGNAVLPLLHENKLLATIRSSSTGREKYNDFIRNNLDKAIRRGDISFFRGPDGQHHFFIPLRVEDMALTIVGGGVFLTAADFEDFFKREGEAYGLIPGQLKLWHEEIRVMNYSDLRVAAKNIRMIFNDFLQSDYKKILYEKKYRLLKAMLSVFSEIKLDGQAVEVCDILIDSVIFLFNADSISVVVKDNGVFKTQKAVGRLKDDLQSLRLNIVGLVSETVETQVPLYSESVLDISRSGFSDKVTSVYMFPIIFENRVTGILNIFNSAIYKGDADIISSMCMIAGCLLHLLKVQGDYNKALAEKKALNAATDRLATVKEPDTLYETILDISLQLVEAEKGSLMLIDEGTSYLSVKAAKGINKKLFGEIRIKAGEGIAGRVFKESRPLIVDDIEKNEWGFVRRPKYRTGSFMSIPLRIVGKTAGVLNISDKLTGEIFTHEDMVILSSFTSGASIALERSNYYSLVAQLRELSITDSLTGIFNRRYFEERFLEELHRSDRHNLSFSLALLDVDDFKIFNDTEGHVAGDEILKYIASIARDSLRISDVISRFGGEEFAVIMPQTEMEEAFLVAERIRKSVREQLPRTWGKFPRDNVTVSIGIATFPSEGENRDELIRNADKALYMAKMQGKDRSVISRRKLPH